MNVNNESLTNLRLRLADLTKGVVGLFATVRMEQVEDGPNAQELADNVTSTLEELATAIDMLPAEIHEGELFDDYGQAHVLTGSRLAINRMERHIKSIRELEGKMMKAVEMAAQAEVLAKDARAQLHGEQSRRITAERDLQRAMGYLDRVNDEGNSPRRRGPTLDDGRISHHDYARDVDDCGRPSVNVLLRNSL